MSDEKWVDEVVRCKYATEDRKKRRKASEAAAAERAAAAAMPGLGLGSSEGGRVYHPAPGGTQGSATSPSYSQYYEDRFDSSTPLSQLQFSTEVGESEVAGDPNSMFSATPRRTGLGLDLNRSYSVSPALRRAPFPPGHVTDGTGLPRSLFATGETSEAGNPFEQMTGDRYEYGEVRDHHDIIENVHLLGLATPATCLTICVRVQAMGAEVLSGMWRGAHHSEPVAETEDADDYDEDDDEERESDVVDVETGATTKTKRVGCRGPKWKSLEDKCLVESWKAVSLDPITGANQTAGKYYKRIYDQFNERKQFGEYATIHMIRNEGGLSHRWNTIKKACNKFHGHLETIKKRKESGKTMVDYVSC